MNLFFVYSICYLNGWSGCISCSIAVVCALCTHCTHVILITKCISKDFYFSTATLSVKSILGISLNHHQFQSIAWWALTLHEWDEEKFYFAYFLRLLLQIQTSFLFYIRFYIVNACQKICFLFLFSFCCWCCYCWYAAVCYNCHIVTKKMGNKNDTHGRRSMYVHCAYKLWALSSMIIFYLSFLIPNAFARSRRISFCCIITSYLVRLSHNIVFFFTYFN